MTKIELETLGREYGIELDRRKKKATLIEEIKSAGNQVGAYMSIGTGEDWRDDFSEIGVKVGRLE